MDFPLTGTTPEEKLKELTDKLEQGVREIFTSGRYAEYLSAMSKFHTYSFGNVMLILMQNPAASHVAGFHTWKKEFGRNVKAHESGLKILAPCPYRRFVEQDKLDKDGKPVLDVNGKPVRERTLVQLMRFRIVTVFDISQTEGKELPSIGVSELSGNIDRFEELANAITSVSPVPILYEAPHGAAKGCFNHVTEEILIRPGMSQKQTVKTMLHEISHATLHRRKKNEPPSKDQHTREVEAESVAYVVCQHFGIDTSDYSFGYVAGWSKGKELDELKASLDTIRSCAAGLIDAIEKQCPSLAVSRQRTVSATLERYYDEDNPEDGCIRYPTEAECERLMGLPPDWTKYGADGAEIRSSSRYMALGNSIALPCAEYIMAGIAEALQK